MNINNFNAWFGVFFWDGKTSDEMAESIYNQIWSSIVPNKDTGKKVPKHEIITKFKETLKHNEKLFLTPNLHPQLKELGNQHQAMIMKVLEKLNSLN